ncbi:enoyl-CoA hydratase/isomerase family protein [Fodinicurvata sediminis]|uniref:enoyl-CoA hydratase/isomerase family protein n=1 Tax=Fodinicurvata sediminis TaxID=1121832 RepID=UPI0003B5E02A|nr:enoyl-CoA hydratase/isomerase family protein [Fodinicurvata sediminis]
MSGNLVLCEIDSGTARLTLNRPERHNSLVPELLEDLLDAIAEVRRDNSVRVVVLAAEGRSFSTGGDLATFHDAEDMAVYGERIVGQLNEAILALLDLPLPVIARIQGPVTGGSLGLVLAADLVVLAEEAFIAPYYVEVGFSPDGGWSALLPERIGHARAAEIQLLNRQVDAEEAGRLGLAHAVVPAGTLDSQVNDWVEILSSKVQGGLHATKARLLAPARRAAIAQALEAERRGFIEQAARPETRAGVARFLGRAV